MIHNGGAMGGHYFAYIKDITTDKWYNFNDSTVREINLIELVETFGPEVIETGPGKKSNLAAKRMAASRSSNAYMLMYRIFDPSEDKTALGIHEG
jgi:ubiquitin carboxyl-terminal hydrolase 47